MTRTEVVNKLKAIDERIESIKNLYNQLLGQKSVWEEIIKGDYFSAKSPKKSGKKEQ